MSEATSNAKEITSAVGAEGAAPVAPDARGSGGLVEARRLIFEAMDLIEPWRTHCDYRAERSLQEAFRLLDRAAAATGAGR